MKSLPLLLSACLVASMSLKAQTLFSYADKNVSAPEYLRAFNKVHTTPLTNKEQKIREYLELYINSKLKIQEAISRGYDTLSTFIEELNALRNQVIENYMNDPESLNKLVEEAFNRSQKDINVQHIYIPYVAQPNFSDSTVVKLKAQEAYMELVSGKNFDDVALKYSADPSVKENKGRLGFLTVFSLPYEFENIVYNLAPGKISPVYKSGFGYHIFKNLGERKAVGKIKAAQILIVVPPGSNELTTKTYEKLADSIYQRLMKGDDFAKLAHNFSNDVVSAASGGVMPEFGIGTYDPAFESAVISLPKDGAISKPFLTSHGYHIVKRISLTPPPSVKNKSNLDHIALLVEQDPRINVSKEMLYNKVIAKAGFKSSNINPAMLQAYVDSTLAGKSPSAANTLKGTDVMLMIGRTAKHIDDFIFFTQSNRFKSDGSGEKPFNQLMDEFRKQTVLEYYRDHLEEFNDEFAWQMNELKDGNLFFDIMMKEVWTKAQTDSAGQAEYYNQHKKKYTWIHSADAAVFYCGDEATAKSLRDEVVKNHSDWKTIMENYSEKASADSGRFETSKIPGAQKANLKEGLVTEIQKNKDDNSASFAYVIKIYNQPEQKNFAEARGDIITDYQDALDKSWISELRKKYIVKVNDAVLKSIIK